MIMRPEWPRGDGLVDVSWGGTASEDPREWWMQHRPAVSRADVSSRSIPAMRVSLRLLAPTLGMNSHPADCWVGDSSKVAIWIQSWAWRQPSCGWLRSLSFGHLERMCAARLGVAVWKACWFRLALCRNKINNHDDQRITGPLSFDLPSQGALIRKQKYPVSLQYPAFLCCRYQLTSTSKTRPLLNSTVLHTCHKIKLDSSLVEGVTLPPQLSFEHSDP